MYWEILSVFAGVLVRSPLSVLLEVEIVRALLEAGADANKATRNGTTPMRAAEMGGFDEIVGAIASRSQID